MTYSISEEQARLSAVINYEFKDPSLLARALTHKSFSNENRLGKLENNERLEFLGDAVLELSMTEFLMEHYPEDPEGVLSNKRSLLVNESSLAKVAETLGIQTALLLGRGEKVTQGHLKPRLLASALEALLGAIYLDSDFKTVKPIIRNIFREDVENLQSESESHKDYKTRLQELIQKQFQVTPTYALNSTDGPEHEKMFFVSVTVDDRSLASGLGRSKKEAEQDAAKKAWEGLQQ